MNDAAAIAVRDVLMSGLLAIDKGLENFFQTTHGALGPHNISDVAEQLVKTWETPTDFNISELSQRILNLNRQRIANTNAIGGM